jgi:hypothetical protein
VNASFGVAKHDFGFAVGSLFGFAQGFAGFFVAVGDYSVGLVAGFAGDFGRFLVHFFTLALQLLTQTNAVVYGLAALFQHAANGTKGKLFEQQEHKHKGNQLDNKRLGAHAQRPKAGRLFGVFGCFFSPMGCFGGE